MNLATRMIADTRKFRIVLATVVGLGLIGSQAHAAQNANVPPAPYGPYSASGSGDPGHNWVPRKPGNQYSQAPNWNTPGNTSRNANRQPAQQRQAPSPQYGQQTYSQQPYRQQPYARPGYTQPRTSYNSYQGNYYGQPSYNRPPAAGGYRPGYRPAYGYSRPPFPPPKRKKKRRFWGETTPKDLMHPTKDNWEQAWDDMMLSPSRAGEMPGGWYAPEVYLPNPVDMTDQVKDNVKDLPEQIKDMDVGNTVSDDNE